MATMTTAPSGAGKTPTWERPTRLTALHREHLAHGATLAERGGWLIPSTYGNAAAETATLREAVGVLDIGESAKFDLKSGDLDGALAAAFPKLGTVAVSAVATVDKSTSVYRLTAGQALVLTDPTKAGALLRSLETMAASRACTHVTDLTSVLCGIRILGPKAPALLALLSSVDFGTDRFANGALAQAGVARAHAIVGRRDTAGISGYDIYVDRDLGAYLWESLFQEGNDLGIKPVGRDAEASLGKAGARR
jgi:heterotetrameric sarcosine oxidase gamma subunit